MRGALGPDPAGRTLAGRLAALDEPLPARVHRALGPAGPIYDALLAHTPPDAVVVMRGPADRRHMLTMRALTALCAPRRFVVPVAASRTVQPPYFLLTFEADRAEPRDAGVTRLAAGERFTLDAVPAAPGDAAAEDAR